MIKIGTFTFREVWLVDFEFKASPGENPEPICLIAIEMGSGRKLKIWQSDLISMNYPPYPIDNGTLFVAYYASAEMNCHLSLRWPMPENVLDLFTEFRNHTNGQTVPCGNGLLGASAFFGLSSIEAVEKDSMRELALRGGPWTDQEKLSLLEYCESDVIALNKLLLKMIPIIDLQRALLRGRFMKTAAFIEYNGIPIDTVTLAAFRENWKDIQKNLMADIDTVYGVFDGLTFKRDRFAKWLVKNNIPWPLLPSGNLKLCDNTFKEMSITYPEVQPLRDLRSTLSQMRLKELTVGKDGRNRTLLSAFRSRTGRNQPSNSKFIFCHSAWLRGLIKPQREFGLAYIDWSQQEFGIAAALSEDSKMIEAYESGDPYLAFAKQCGAVPEDATKESHYRERDLFKACVLAVQYGMGAKSLALKISQPVCKANELLRLHQETYKTFWEWSDGAVDYAALYGKLWTVFGWTVRTMTNFNPRSLRNFPMQANGAEMLRLACCLAFENGIKICAPIHDAILIEAKLKDLKAAITSAQKAMAEASAMVLNGFRLRTDVEVIKYPNRFMDKRGEAMWERVQRILKKLNQ